MYYHSIQIPFSELKVLYVLIIAGDSYHALFANQTNFALRLSVCSTA